MKKCNIPGPRSGVKLSEMKWRTVDNCLHRSHAGTFNRAILSAFLVPVEPTKAIPALVQWFEKSPLRCSGKVRAYVQGRIYELRRRGLLVEIIK